MRPSGVTRHPASGTTITFGKTFRFAEGKGPPTVVFAFSLFILGILDRARGNYVVKCVIQIIQVA